MSEIQELVQRLQGLEAGCEDKCIDLKTLQFDISEGEMKLYNEFNNYFFKTDPKNPRDPKITHAAQQFCKMMKVPYSFFAKNPEYMKKQIVSCWLPTLKPEQSTVLMKMRKGKEDSIIRAILPVEFTNIRNVEIIEQVACQVQDDYKIDFSFGDEKDDLVLHLRLVSNDEFEVRGEKCAVGFSVVASELGASPLIVETLLFRCLSKASFIASYSTEPFFSFEYQHIQKSDLQNLFPALIDHLKDKLGEIKQKVQEAQETDEKEEDIKALLRKLHLVKRLSEKFHTMLYQELEKDSVKTMWDFVNKMSIVAKDFSVDQRLRIERTAGALLGLVFPKN